MYKQLETSLLTDTRGAILLENFQRCVNSGVVRSTATQDFQNALDGRASAYQSANGLAPDALKLRDMVVDTLEGLTAPVDISALQQSFRNSSRKSGFDACRVLTKLTLRDRYLEDEIEEDSFGLPVSFDPLDDLMTDSEFDQGSRASSPPAMRLLPKFSLCRSNGIAFITDLPGWESLRTNTGTNPADRAAEYLGLPYNEGEALVMLRIRAEAINNWSAVRRPTIFDALDHGWWICWPGDPLDCGHTLDLAGLAEGAPTLRMGGLEWVINDQVVDSSAGKVVAIELGTTKKNTHPEGPSALWKDFHGQLKPNGLN